MVVLDRYHTNVPAATPGSELRGGRNPQGKPANIREEPEFQKISRKETPTGQT